MTGALASTRPTLHDGLRRWATATPDRVAVSDGVDHVTFGELLPLVESTAANVRAAMADTHAQAYVPVLVDRSVGSAVAMLACALGGVRFFPVDAAASPELIGRLVQRAGGPACYLSGSGEHPALASASMVEVAADAVAGAPPPPARDDQPAVVLFSSGSTGVPKGIVLSWSAMDQRWRSRDARADEMDAGARRQPLIMPLDSSWGLNQITDVASGFTVRIVDVQRMRPSEFLAEMATFAPTAIALPSQLGRILAQLPEHSVVRLPSVRRINIGSEGFRYEYVKALGRIFEPDAAVVHTLSSTEGSREIGNTFALRDCPDEGQVHLGHTLFPGDLRVVPVPGLADGVGEVHVSGAIASGYLDDPELTAARFYEDADGRSWWRSGDLVSVDHTGMYRHEGRMDDVVKVGGKLASPSEVTAVLQGIEGVVAAITVPVVTDGNTRLVSHVEIEPGTEVRLEAVRATLRARLQPHAVPSAVMRHRRMPVNVRGKVDRQALADGPFEPW